MGASCCGGAGDGAQCPAGYGLQADGTFADQTLACKGRRCVACGGRGEPCCQQFSFSPPSCDLGSICTKGKCAACGDSGKPCCPSSLSFSSVLCPGGDDLRCTGSNGRGTCKKCGRANQICCLPTQVSEPECDVGFNCAGASRGDLRDGECKKCGGLGQQCCAAANGILREPCSEGGACSGGKCVECGGLGQPCCPDINQDLWRMCGRAGAARNAYADTCAAGWSLLLQLCSSACVFL